MEEITATMRKQARARLAEYGRKVLDYTVGLVFERDGKFSYGTAVPVQSGSTYFLLTASHVARSLKRCANVRILYKLDEFRRVYPPRQPYEFDSIDWDPSFDDHLLDEPKNFSTSHPRDLAALFPSRVIVEQLKAYKAFATVSTEIAVSTSDALVALGGILPEYDNSGLTCYLTVGPYGVTLSEHYKCADYDYLICPTSNKTTGMLNGEETAIDSFQGLSGGGLWKMCDTGPSLVGIAIAQDPAGYDEVSGIRNLYFMGPRSIHNAVSTIMDAQASTAAHI